ncbi:hypothetical protein F7396_20085 [Salmonella enterica]|nr:hypothetical protein [Salmonella enterica]ECD4514757.1 hypothetical protein [Salmonella enterica subsp. enterica serovar Sandiego]ECF1356155.1 hypothetical protein [Salmonella enterica subsp. enterica serovar Sandiego]ECV4068522.1 hypothetical protein [Salmonella enterica]ECZ0995769.1 hypothetical protein [Salmonella enterica]
MKRYHGSLTGLILVGGVLISGCAEKTTVSRVESVPPEVTQGMLGDLDIYIHQLLSQRGGENGQAEKTLVCLLSGKGLPESVVLSSAARGE